MATVPLLTRKVKFEIASASARQASRRHQVISLTPTIARLIIDDGDALLKNEERQQIRELVRSSTGSHPR